MIRTFLPLFKDIQEKEDASESLFEASEETSSWGQIMKNVTNNRHTSASRSVAVKYKMKLIKDKKESEPGFSIIPLNPKPTKP